MIGRPSVLFYCQHSVGLGHLVRSFELARALTERFRVVLLSGGLIPEALAPPAGVEVHQLPPLRAAGDGSLQSADPARSLDEVREARLPAMLRALADVHPDVVLVELFPFGRKKFAGELVPWIEAARGLDPRPLVACSLRDILVRGRDDQQAYDDRVAAIANRLFDAVLVHADPRFARLEESFRPSEPLRTTVLHTGFVVPPARRSAAPASWGGTRTVLVSAGGGVVGEPLFRAALAAQRVLGPPAVHMRIVAGPFLPEPAWVRLQAEAGPVPGLEVVRSVPDLEPELRSATVSVSQCGYNTALGVVRAGLPALVVPYADGHEDEQTNRADRLRELGAVRVLPASDLTPGRLATAIEGLFDFRPEPVRLDLDGARNASRLLAAMVAGRDHVDEERTA